jgi:hypothetical protein
MAFLTTSNLVKGTGKMSGITRTRQSMKTKAGSTSIGWPCGSTITEAGGARQNGVPRHYSQN